MASTFDGSGGEAGDEVLLQEQEQHHDGDRDDDGAGGEVAPLLREPPTKNRSPTGAVYIASLSMKVAARMNSFHAVMNENSAVTATAGLASGRTMRKKIWPGDAPSISAASSSSRGIVSK